MQHPYYGGKVNECTLPQLPFGEGIEKHKVGNTCSWAELSACFEYYTFGEQCMLQSLNRES